MREPDNTIAPLRNVTAFLTMLRHLNDRGAGLPGMGCFYGPAGWGKSSAAVYSGTTGQTIVIQLGYSVTKRWLCEQILREIGVKPRGGIPHMIDAIAEHLAVTGTPLILDEADHLVDKKHIELAREIYEKSLSPVVLIGEEGLPQKMQAFERLASRMLVWQAAEPCDGEDLRILGARLCPGIDLTDEVTARLLEVCRGSLRRMATNLDGLRHHALLRGTDRLTLGDLEGFDFYTGLAPAARRRVA